MSLTCVSGYWKVKNKHNDNFKLWFERSLKINCPYIIFSDKEGIELMKPYREGIETIFIELNIKDFYTYKYKDDMTTTNRYVHCPSAELNMIWNEKIFLLERAYELNPFNTDYFKWIDAGICCYRNTYPPTTTFPNTDKLLKLPTDKFIFSTAGCVKVTAGSFIIHSNIIKQIVDLFKYYLNEIIQECINLNKKGEFTEQHVLIRMYEKNKNVFYPYGHGWGGVLTHLY